MSPWKQLSEVHAFSLEMLDKIQPNLAAVLGMHVEIKSIYEIGKARAALI